MIINNIIIMNTCRTHPITYAILDTVLVSVSIYVCVCGCVCKYMTVWLQATRITIRLELPSVSSASGPPSLVMLHLDSLSYSGSASADIIHDTFVRKEKKMTIMLSGMHALKLKILQMLKRLHILETWCHCCLSGSIGHLHCYL